MKTILVLVKVLLAVFLVISSSVAWSQTTAKATTTTVVLTYADLVKMQEDVAKAQKDVMKMQEGLVKAQADTLKAREDASKAQKAVAKLSRDVSLQKQINKKQAQVIVGLEQVINEDLKKEIAKGQQQNLELSGKIQALESANEQQKISEADLRALISSQSTALWSVACVMFGLTLCLFTFVWRKTGNLNKDLIRTTEITTNTRARAETAINVANQAKNAAGLTRAAARVAGAIANEATIGLSQINKFVGFQDVSFPPDFETRLAELSAENKTYRFTVTCDSSNEPIHLAVEWKRPGFIAIRGIKSQEKDVKIKDVKTVIGRAGKLDRNGDHRLVGVLSDQGNLEKGARTTICTLSFAYTTTHSNVSVFSCTTYTVKAFRMKLRP